MLDESEIRALHEALDDEYRAWATYDQVIADFGEVRPFINIREAEARHMAALQRLFARYASLHPALRRARQRRWMGRRAAPPGWRPGLTWDPAFLLQARLHWPGSIDVEQE